MHKIILWRQPIAKYSCWLAIIAVLFLFSSLLANAEILKSFPQIEVFASYALVGVWAFLAAGLGAVLLAILEQVGFKFRLSPLNDLPKGFVFALFITVWLNLLRLLLAAFGLHLDSVSSQLELLIFFVVGGIIFVVYRRALVQWVDETAGRLRNVVLVIVVGCCALSTYFAWELFAHKYERKYETQWVQSKPTEPLPNIILIVLDSLTTEDMSLYGYPLPTTPNLDQLTPKWMIYENAHSSGTTTFAILPTLLTGRYPYLDDKWYEYGDWVRANRGWLSFPRVLQDLGYETVYMRGQGYNPNLYHLQAGFNLITDGRNNRNSSIGDLLSSTTWASFGPSLIFQGYLALESIYPKGSTFSESVYAELRQYLTQKAVSAAPTPFFVYAHMARPHFPYLGNEFMGKFLPIEDGLGDTWSQLQVPDPYSPDQQSLINRMRLRYDENILKADQELSQLIDLLRELNLYDQSLVIVTADHGTDFTSGEYWGYNSPLLRASEHHIPILIKFPGQVEGKRIPDLVSNVDIAPTVLDAVGVSYPVTWVDGQSLVRGVENKDRVVYSRTVRVPNKDEPSGGKWVLAALKGNMKLLSRNGTLSLFDLSRDPEERQNLLGRVNSDDLQSVLKDFVRRTEFVRSGGDIRQWSAP